MAMMCGACSKAIIAADRNGSFAVGKECAGPGLPVRRQRTMLISTARTAGVSCPLGFGLLTPPLSRRRRQERHERSYRSRYTDRGYQQANTGSRFQSGWDYGPAKPAATSTPGVQKPHWSADRPPPLCSTKTETSMSDCPDARRICARVVGSGARGGRGLFSDKKPEPRSQMLAKSTLYMDFPKSLDQGSVYVPLHDYAGDGHGRESDATQNEADDCETLAVSHFSFLRVATEFRSFRRWRR